MKAYITCPVSQSNERLNLLPEIQKVVEENKIIPHVFTIGGESKDIFKRDYDELKSSNILIAEVSEPSHGVGIEIGLAYSMNLKIILLLQKGKAVSRLAHGIPGVIVLEYVDIEELKQKLSLELHKIRY